MISVAVIEDINEIRESLVEYFKLQPNILCKIAVESIEEFLKKSLQVNKYDIILLDIGLPGISGIDAIKLIKEKWSETDIIMFTVYDDQNRIFQALCAGATGYMLKNTPFPKIKEALE
jgi:DNA-binding NarL/FixJ family response regulator